MKRSKYILKIIVIVISLFIFLGIGIKFIFGSKIEAVILNRINAELKSDLIVSNIEFSLLEDFPYSSVTLFDLRIKSSKGEGQLLYLEKAVIQINLLSLLFKNYSIDKVILKDGDIYLEHDKNGSSNFDIFKDDKKGQEDFEIESLEIRNVNISYFDIKDSSSFQSLIGLLNIGIKIVDNKSEVSINGKLFANKLLIQNLDYINGKKKAKEKYVHHDPPLRNKKITAGCTDLNAINYNSLSNIDDSSCVYPLPVTNINTQIVFQNDSIKMSSASIIIDGAHFKHLECLISDNKYLLNFETQNEEIEDIINIIPEDFQYLFDESKLSGTINSAVQINGDENTLNPDCQINFTLKDSEYTSLVSPFNISKINCKGSFNNGDSNNLSTSKLVFSDFTSKKETGFINGDFTITNFNEYHLTANLSSHWELKEINAFIENSPFNNLYGELRGNLKYDGKLSFDDGMKKHITNSIYSGNWEFKNVSFNYKESPLNFIFKESSWEIEGHIIKIKDDNFQVSESKLTFNGEIHDLFLYLLDQKSTIHIKGYLSSEYVKFQELFTIKDINGEDHNEIFVSVMPNWFDVKITFDIAKFQYHDFYSNQFEGEIEYESNTLKLNANKMRMKALNGEISGNVFYYENRIHDLVLKSNIKLSKIDISKGFSSFDNFGQTFITHENIKGKAFSDIYIRSMWDKDDKFYSKSLYVKADLKIEDGELLEFEPLYNLSDYASLDELKNVKFATLENQLRIDDEKIIIPEMDIYSTALGLHVSGTHTFQNKMDYKIRLLLSDLLSNKMKRKSKKINLEDLQDHHEGKTTIQFKMTGDIDSPNISIDRLQLQKDVMNEIIKETEEITNIIKEDVLDNSPKGDQNNEQDSGIEIEWKDENK